MDNFSIVLHGISMHSNCDHGKGPKAKTCDLKNFNPGAAIDWRFYNSPSWGRLSLRAGMYNDSYDKTAYYSGATYIKTWSVNEGFFVGGGGQIGYLNGSGLNGLAAIPMLVIGYERLFLEVGYAPKVSWGIGHNHVSVINFSLRLEI